MTKHIKTPGSQAIHEARKVVREEFPDAPEWAIKRLALLMCARDGYEASLALGERLDLDALLKVDAVIEEIRAKLTKEKPHSISVSFVEGVVGSYRCSHCNQWNEIPEGQYTPAKTGRPEPAHLYHLIPLNLATRRPIRPDHCRTRVSRSIRGRAANKSPPL